MNKIETGVVISYDPSTDNGLIETRDGSSVFFGMVAHCTLISNGNGAPVFGNFGGSIPTPIKLGVHVVFEMGELGGVVARWARLVDFKMFRGQGGQEPHHHHNQQQHQKRRHHQNHPRHTRQKEKDKKSARLPSPRDQTPSKPADPVPVTPEPPEDWSLYAKKRWRKHQEALAY